jgi:hypothetical protein
MGSLPKVEGRCARCAFSPSALPETIAAASKIFRTGRPFLEKYNKFCEDCSVSPLTHLVIIDSTLFRVMDLHSNRHSNFPFEDPRSAHQKAGFLDGFADI